jgi:hypothetical protein
MRFPAYVPAAIRLHVSKLMPALAALTDPERALDFVRQYFEVQNKTGDYYHRRFNSFMDEHLATLIEKRNRTSELMSHKECLVRLANDERMRQAYADLSRQFDDDERWHKLAWAATTSDIEFRPHMIGLAHAAGLCERISDVSDYLCYLLDEIDDTNVEIPAFYAMSALVKEEGEELMDDLLWLRVRTVIAQVAEKAEVTAIKIRKRQLDARDPFAWRFRQIEYNSPHQSVLASALKTRQSNRKTQYLRAFGCGLTLDDPGALTPTVQKAMADIATVMINDPDIVVTYDDVRGLFGRRKRNAARNSRKKARPSLPLLE